MSEIDPFQSHTIATILAWICSAPMLIGAAAWALGMIFDKPAEISRAFAVWAFLCVLLLTPFRYILWQLITATCYSVQSFRAFFDSMIMLTYVPIVFGIMYAIALGLPIVGTIWLVGAGDNLSKGRQLAASIVLPFACVICSTIYYSVLPFAAWTVSWAQPVDAIRATNGPSGLFYEYVAIYGTPIRLPKYFSETEQTIKDLVRCHVATVYLSSQGEAYFVREQYPDLYERITSK